MTDGELEIEGRGGEETIDYIQAGIETHLEEQSPGPSDRPYLPPDIFREDHWRETEAGSMLNTCSTGFRVLTVAHLAWLHIRPQVAEHLQLNETMWLASRQ